MEGGGFGAQLRHKGKSQNLLSMANFAKICKRDELKFGKGSTLGENSWKGVRKQTGRKGTLD